MNFTRKNRSTPANMGTATVCPATIRNEFAQLAFALGVARHGGSGPLPVPVWVVDSAAAFDRILNIAEARGWRGRAGLMRAVCARQVTPEAVQLISAACATLTPDEMLAEMELARGVMPAVPARAEGNE